MMVRHKPPSNRLHHTVTGTPAAEEEPMMVHSHMDMAAANDDRTRLPVVHLQRNVIARLMGIDATNAVVPTPPTKPVVQSQAQRRGQTNNKCSSLQLPYDDDDDDAEYCGPSSRSRLCLHSMMMVGSARGSGWRPHTRLRRLPQEEELLRKMRQDLRAWQASMAPTTTLETSGGATRPPDGGRSRSSSLVLQAIAQEDLRRQKMARYGLAFGLGGRGRHSNDALSVSLDKAKKKNGSVAQGGGDHDEDAAAAQPATAMPDDSDSVVIFPSSTTTRPRAAAAPAAQAQESPSSHGHTPIVLLKPTTATGGGVAIGGGGCQKIETVVLAGLPKLHRDANMSVLLQEVKDRVQRERTCGELIKTPPRASAWGIPPLQQQQTVVNKEESRRLFRRSESFRAFRRDRKRNASPDAHETAVMSPEKKKAGDEESLTDAPLLPSVLRPGVGGVPDDDGRSFRSEECLALTKNRDEASSSPPSSPRLLFRSFSAPEPGTGFAFSLGRLFSSSDTEPAAAVTMTSKSVVGAAGFSSFIRGTVSSLMRRHGFSSSTRNLLMFRRKRNTHWSWSSSNNNSNNKTSPLGAGEIHPAKMETEMPICTTPPSHQTFSLFKVAQASLSELPPSPVSPLEVAVAAGRSPRHFFTDLHFTLPVVPEVSPKCLSDLGAPRPTASEPSASASVSYRTDVTAVVEAAWSRDKAYITELLIAAGLYDDGPSLAATDARVDSMATGPMMPICDDVFEDVEDMYYYRGDYIVTGMYDDDGTTATDHRMLFDLANEALQSLVASSRGGGGSSSLRRWVVDSTATAVARRKKLVDEVWQQVQDLRNNNPQQEMQTIDGMAAYEVRRSVWAEEVLCEDVYVVGRKIERAIFGELIEDLACCC